MVFVFILMRIIFKIFGFISWKRLILRRRIGSDFLSLVREFFGFRRLIMRFIRNIFVRIFFLC